MSIQMSKGKFLLTLVAAGMLAATGFTILRAASAVSKGYVISEITVTDPEAYKQYAAAVQPIAAKFSGKFLVRGGQTVAVEGEPPASRVVVIEFDSLAAARSFEDSPDYQAVTPLRHKAAHSRVFLVEGVSQ
jgi:uncharacterized protein (DUF1330 family)